MNGSKKDTEAGFLASLRAVSQIQSSDFRIEINGNREIIAEGCLGVMSCGEEQIRLNMGKCSLVLTGCDLVISNMFGKTVCIHGHIASAEFI